MLNVLYKNIAILGPHRFLLALVSIASIVLCGFSDASLPPEGWNIIFAVVAPAVPPLLFMVYGLDLLMTRVWRNEFGGEYIARFDKIAIFNLIMMIVLVVAWLPVFLRN